MASGMTCNLDSIYPAFVGPKNGCLGGDGDGWERGSYWIDGLLPLAYILYDKNLKSKVTAIRRFSKLGKKPLSNPASRTESQVSAER